MQLTTTTVHTSEQGQRPDQQGSCCENGSEAASASLGLRSEVQLALSEAIPPLCHRFVLLLSGVFFGGGRRKMICGINSTIKN